LVACGSLYIKAGALMNALMVLFRVLTKQKLQRNMAKTKFLFGEEATISLHLS
jgi:hypothetical protein